MNMYENPIASDGQFSIGYDADGVAGQWPGNMTETCRTIDWMSARLDAEFCDGAEVYVAVLDGEDVVWQNPDGTITPVREILQAGGDK